MEFMKVQEPKEREPEEQLRKKTLETTTSPNKTPSVTGLAQTPPAPLAHLHTSQEEGAGELQNEGEGGEHKELGSPGTGPSLLGSPTAAAAAKAAESGASTDLQKKLSRAERFGMPVQLSEEEKRNSRSERFGTVSTLHGKSEVQKKQARAERFGLSGQSTSDEEAKKKARLARFAQDSKADNLEEEKRNARAIRFSQTKSGPAFQTNGKSNPEQKTPNVDENKGGT